MSSFHPTAYTSAADALAAALRIRESGDWSALERFCIDALQHFPHDIELSWQLSHCHWLRYDGAASEAVMRACLAHHPESAQVKHAIAFYLLEQARYNEAEAMYRESSALDPEQMGVALDLADLELRRGAWRDGWTRFLRRLDRTRDTSSVVRVMEALAPRWRGEPLAGKRIVVYSELGLGDDLQFVRLYPRFAAAVKQLGAQPLLAVRAPLQPLIERFVPDCVTVETHDFDAIDFTIGMMSMPYWLGLSPAEIDGRPYLDAEPSLVQTWRDRLADDGRERLRVGIVWAGSPTHRRDSQRSIPVDALAPLWQLSGVTFYPVAPGRDADIARMRAAGADIVDVTQHYREHFHDSAALVTALDALVTIDSSPLHLGGALGRPVLAMIDRASHWCWGTGETQPWYDSVRLVRQQKAGDWTPVVARVAADLAQRAAIKRR
ncbi:TPR repeat [Candidatus Burkholderia verschuerenii]|uniref:TPR repeat n=1 Tax=Candidatus Burkholderia verschuerenii TaxID=242163 RepID=A0A0L0MH32_9BURK|nr:hypothetical protein [Candidatus Burkholderia verschuerenii]KND62007.1 TPR repeat [Candidatus Burkholderia verschuerenii]